MVSFAASLGLQIQSMVPPCPWDPTTSSPDPHCLQSMEAGWAAMPALDHLSILGGDDGPVILPPPEQLGVVKAFSAAVRR